MLSNAENVDVEVSHELVQEDSRMFTIQRNPMEIHLIVENLFRFVKFEDLKNCRLVSSLWSHIGKVELRKRSRIVIDDNTGNVGQFLETFNTYKTKQKFTAFKFAGCDGGWETEALDMLFHKNKRSMEELKMHSTDPFKRDQRVIRSCNVSHWVKGSKITKLSLDTRFACRLSLSLRHLPGLKELYLNAGNLNLQEGMRLRLTTLDLRHVNFFQLKTFSPQVYLNDHFDFTNATDVKIVARKFREDIKISLKDFVNVNVLHLQDVGIMDWATATCTVDSLTMSRNPIVEPTAMIIKELTIKSGYINLYYLPQSVEKLCMYSAKASIFSTQPMDACILPNMNTLHMQVDTRCTAGRHIPYLFLRYLTDCPEFVNFSVGGRRCVCQLEFIPLRIKNLKCRGRALRNAKGNFVEYKKLIFLEVDLDYAFRMLSTGLSTNILVLECIQNIEVDMGATVSSILNLRNFTVYIGRFKWTPNAEIESSYLYNTGRIDTMAEYYVFVNGTGQPITKQQFNEQKKFSV